MPLDVWSYYERERGRKRERERGREKGGGETETETECCILAKTFNLKCKQAIFSVKHLNVGIYTLN